MSDAAPSLSPSGAVWRGAVVGAVVLVAQVAFALPMALAGDRVRAMWALFAMFVGVPVSGLLVAGLVASLLGLARPVVVAPAGLVLTVGLAALGVLLGVPHLPTTTDPGVLAFGAVFALPGYTAAAVAVAPLRLGRPGRGIAVGLAVVVAAAGSLGWLAFARDAREAALTGTGVPMVLADIPGHRLESVELADANAPLVLYYSPPAGASVPVTVGVGRTERRPRTCEDVLARFHGDRSSLPCHQIGDRWVVDDLGGFRYVVAVHDDAVVTLTGQDVPGLAEARLRTATSSELAAAPPGRH